MINNKRGKTTKNSSGLFSKKGQEEKSKLSSPFSYYPFKKGQEENQKISTCLFSKKGQEEMVGFALIVIIVSVVILIFIAIMMYSKNSSSSVKSYELESFISSLLTYTTNCSELSQEYLNVQKLISRCTENGNCDSGENSCELLKKVLEGTIDESWNTEQKQIKGYVFRVLSDSNSNITIKSGENLTGNSRTAVQNLIISTKNISVILDIYG